MAKKSARRKFGVEKELEDAGERLADGLERASEGFERGFKARHFHHECGGACCGGFWFGPGFLGVLLKSIFGVFFIFLASVAIKYVAAASGQMFFNRVSDFLSANLALFFALALVFGFAEYFTRKFASLRPLNPLVSATNAVVSLIIFAMLIRAVDLPPYNPVFGGIAGFIETQTAFIFLFFLVACYIGFAFKAAFGNSCLECKKSHSAEAQTRRQFPGEKRAGIRRLYRSDKDRVLGGVCGGIGEYLGVDPVVIRLLWLFAALMGGFGVLAYIIAWAIIPRRPV